MSARTLVVTGTDTGVGKTLAACALLRRARARGSKVCGFKPVATGCERIGPGLRNADALALMEASGSEARYDDINPYAFEPAVAPHLAAERAGVRIRTAQLDAAHGRLAAQHDLVIVEGAGGWRVPFDETWVFSEWVAEHDWPVVLVVGMRLGCLNHALLTAESINRRARFAGWIASVLPPEMELLDENIEALRQRLSPPCWGVIPAGADTFEDSADADRELKALAPQRKAGRPT